MAQNASDLNRKVLQNIRTTRTNEEIEAMLSATTAFGEIAVKMGTGDNEDEKRINTSLYTLAADGEVAVRFPSYEAVQEMITGGASIYLNNVIESLGLESGGTLPSDWGTDTNYFGNDATVIDAVNSLDENLNALSGVVESFSADVKTYIDSVSGDVKDYVDTLSGNVHSTIDAMDKDADAQTGHIITTVSQENGLVDETKALLTNIVLSGYEKTNDTGDLAATDSVEVALSKLENNIAAAKSATTVSNTDGSINVAAATTGTVIDVNIKNDEHVLAKDGNAGLYTDIKLSAVTPSSTNVKEEYVLYGTDGTVLGDHIKVYKDANLVQTYLGHVDDALESSASTTVASGTGDTALCFIYQLADGSYQLVAVDVSRFLEETEFASGVTAGEGHIVHGVVANKSEFLYVDGDGFYVSGVTDAIANAVNGLDASATGESSDHRVIVAVGEADGKVSGVTVEISDIASASALTELSGSVIELSGAVQTAIQGFDSSVTGTSEDGRVEIVVAQADGTLSGATVTLSDVASASALTQLSGSVIDEITRAKAAETALDGVVGSTKGANDETRTYTHTDTNYLDESTTVKTDTEALDELLGSHTGDTSGATYDVTFTSSNTVADNISDIRKALADYKQALSLTAVDDDKYIATEVTTGDTGTTIGVSAITMDITASTTGSSALADSWDVKEYTITDRVANDGANNGADSNIQIVAADDDSGKLFDFSEIVVDCGTF